MCKRLTIAVSVWPVLLVFGFLPIGIDAAETRPAIVLLYHNDPAIRISTIEALAATGDFGLIDDLIRAEAVEDYTPVHNVYNRVLQEMTGQRTIHDRGAWKAWLSQAASAGRLKIDYLPLRLDALSPGDRAAVQPLATRLGAEHFDRMVRDLTAKGRDADARSEALRYMVANDSREDVQKFLCSNWLIKFLALDDLNPPTISALTYLLDGLANPGPLRERINAQLRESLGSKDPIVLANALHVLAGVEGNSTRLAVPGVAEKVRKLVDHSSLVVAAQARRALIRVDPKPPLPPSSYEATFLELYGVLGRQYPCFALKGIDWKAVGQELLPWAKLAKNDSEFGLLCMELVARLEDSHAMLGRGTATPPTPPLPRWDPGLACLLDDRDKPVVYYVDQGGPAQNAGVRPGMTLLSINGKPAEDALAGQMKQLSRYVGYSSQRYLRYHAAQFLLREMERDAPVRLELQACDGGKRSLELPASLGVRYLPRLPVPIPGIRDSANVAWKMLDGQIGYLYVRRIRADLIQQLDRAVGDLAKAKGLIIDVRGNSGGGFDAVRSLRNFDAKDSEEPDRPRFAGPIAVLIDARCISAGEGWTSWFVAKKRAELFGEATAGASSRKRTYRLANGLYTVTFPVKAYNGYLDRPIERRGLEPNVPLRQNAADLAAGRDTVLEAAKRYLTKKQ
jgi:carboxyl-terminal processing protease